MNFFKIVTPLTYWILAIIWTVIFVFYIRKLYNKKAVDSFLRILLIILAIDAFRTLFESLYFGAWFTSLSDLLPIAVYNFLAQPQIVFIPKTINLIASVLVLIIIVRKWLPMETTRIEHFNDLLAEKTKRIEAAKEKYKLEAKSSNAMADHYRRVTINSPFPIMIHAEDGEVLLINNSWKEITGYALEEINTISKWTQKAYGSEAVPLKEYIDKLYNIGKAIKEGEFNIRTKTGNDVIWDFSSAPLDMLPDGRRLVISTAVDVTEKKQVQKELIDREARLNTIFEAADNVAFVLTTMEGENSVIKEFSTGAEKIFGYTTAEATGMLVSKLHKDSDVANFDDAQNNMKRHKRSFHGESILRRKNGEEFPAMFTTYPIPDSAGKIETTLGVSIDISNLREAENELKQHKDNLTQLVKERTVDLEAKNEELKNKNIELEKYNKLFVDREFRIKEFREKIKELENEISNQKKV